MGIFKSSKEKAALGFKQFMRRIITFEDEYDPESKKDPESKREHKERWVNFLLEGINSLTKLFSTADLTTANVYLAEFKKEFERKNTITNKGERILKRVLKELKKEGLIEKGYKL